MRLIDADELKICYTGKNSLGTNGNDSKADYASIRKMIDNQPTAYDVDKVVKGLEARRYNFSNAIGVLTGADVRAETYAHAIEIVKGGGTV